MKRLPSKRFGGWELRCNGLQQHNLTAKQFLKMVKDTRKGIPR